MKTLLFIIFFYSFYSLLSQNPMILTEKVIGGSADDGLLMYNEPNTSNHYFIWGSNSGISGDKSEASRGGQDVWIVKTDNYYNILWDKTIGGNLGDKGSSVLFQNDTMFILCQSFSGISGEKTEDSFGSADLWLLACDLNANILWQKVYGGSSYEGFGQLNKLSNGNLLITSLSRSDISGNKTENSIGGDDFWLLEINSSNGDIIKQKTIGTIEEETLAHTLITPQNKILIKGGAKYGISGDKTDIGFGQEDIWIVEIDENFNVLDDHSFGGNNLEYGMYGNITMDSDFYYIACTSSSSPSGNKTAPYQGSFDAFERKDYWILKTDTNFNIIWDKSFGGISDDAANQVFKHEWNKIVVSGWSESAMNGNKTAPLYGGSDIWMIILNEDGEVVREETYGGNDDESGQLISLEGTNAKLAYCIQSNSDISGVKTLPSKGGYDTWLLELDASDFLNTEEIPGSSATISVFPNPFEDHVQMKFGNLEEDVTLHIYSLDGKLLFEDVILSGTEVYTPEINFGENVLIYEITGNKIEFHGKLIKN